MIIYLWMRKKDIIRSRFVNILKNASNKISNIEKHEECILEDFTIARQFLKSNSDITICWADKRNGTVVKSKTE